MTTKQVTKLLAQVLRCFWSKEIRAGPTGQEGASGEGSQTLGTQGLLRQLAAARPGTPGLWSERGQLFSFFWESADPPMWQRTLAQGCRDRKTEAEGRCPADLSGERQAWSEPDSAQLCPLHPPQGCPWM